MIEDDDLPQFDLKSDPIHPLAPKKIENPEDLAKRKQDEEFDRVSKIADSLDVDEEADKILLIEKNEKNLREKVKKAFDPLLMAFYAKARKPGDGALIRPIYIQNGKTVELDSLQDMTSTGQQKPINRIRRILRGIGQKTTQSINTNGESIEYTNPYDHGIVVSNLDCIGKGEQRLPVKYEQQSMSMTYFAADWRSKRGEANPISSFFDKADLVIEMGNDVLKKCVINGVPRGTALEQFADLQIANNRADYFESYTINGILQPKWRRIGNLKSTTFDFGTEPTFTCVFIEDSHHARETVLKYEFKPLAGEFINTTDPVKYASIPVDQITKMFTSSYKLIPQEGEI